MDNVVDDTRPGSTRLVVAPHHILLDLSRLKPLLTRWPAVLPRSENPVVLPLKIGIDKDLLALSNGLSSSMLKRHLTYYVRSTVYRAALTAPGACRHDADGNPVAPVRQEELAFLDRVVRGKTSSPKTRTPSSKEMLIVQTTAKGIKATLVLDPADFAGLQIPDGQGRATIEVTVDQRVVRAEVATKSVRKAVSTAQAAGAGNSVIVLTGSLVENTVVNAGLVATVKNTT